VTGRNVDPRGRGLPKIAEIAITHGDGRVLEAGLPALHECEAGIAQLVCAIKPAVFESCPICLERPGETADHVPPEQLGGSAMTATCAPCNNKLGSRTESALVEWFDQSYRNYYTRDGERRPFGHDRVFMRQASTGEPVWIHERSGTISGLFQGSITSHQAWPHPNQYMNGILKSTYLAATLHLGGVPVGIPSVDEIRAELLAARDSPKRATVGMGPRARALKVYRTGAEASGPPLALVRTEQAGESVYLLSLAGTLLVSWPFPELNPLYRFSRITQS
jgi:hypothetical protein